MRMTLEYCDACQKDITDWEDALGGTPWKADNGCFPAGERIDLIACSAQCLAKALGSLTQVTGDA